MRIKRIKCLTVLPRSELVLSSLYHHMKHSVPGALVSTPSGGAPGDQEVSSDRDGKREVGRECDHIS